MGPRGDRPFVRDRDLLRRSNPFVMLAVGVLLGAMLVAIAKQPGKNTSLSSGDSRRGLNPGSNLAGGGSGPSGGPGSNGVGAGGDAGSSGPTGIVSGAVRGLGTGQAAGNVGQSVANRCAGLTAPGVQGVTDKAIRVGFALADLGALAALYPVGNGQADTDAALAGMRRDGLLPVCGRDIVPIYRKFNVLDPSASRAACDAFADQDHVFAVLTPGVFAADQCLTQEKRIFLMDAGSPAGGSTADYSATPLLFSEAPPGDVELRDLAYWAASSGVLNGESIGVYCDVNGPGAFAPPCSQVQANVIDVLAKLGHPVKDVYKSNAENVSITTAPTQDDGLAVQKFKSDGIQVVFPLFFTSDFFSQARSQGYQAQWIVVGVPMINDAVTGSYPASLEGALGVSYAHIGEEKSGVGPDADAQRCFRYFTQAGNGPAPDPESASGQVIRELCDPLIAFVAGLRAAGNNLTSPSLVAGMETVQNLGLSYYPPQTYGPGKHWGANQHVIEQWHADCRCWKLYGSRPWTLMSWRP